MSQFSAQMKGPGRRLDPVCVASTQGADMGSQHTSVCQGAPSSRTLKAGLRRRFEPALPMPGCTVHSCSSGASHPTQHNPDSSCSPRGMQ
jgi:hypothetical protein